jgi:hypothetical protein
MMPARTIPMQISLPRVTVSIKASPLGLPSLAMIAAVQLASSKKAGPLLFSLDHRGTRNGDPLHLFFSNVAVKLVGSNTWMDAR